MGWMDREPQTERQTPQITPRVKAQAQYLTARLNLIIVVVMTLINIIMAVSGSERYFLFSATIPYFLSLVGVMLAAESGTGIMTLLLAFAAVALGLYFICWLLSKKNYRWMITALVLFSVDCLALLCTMVLSGEFIGSLLDILMHIWVMYYLVTGVKNGKLLETLPPENEFRADTDQPSETDAEDSFTSADDVQHTDTESQDEMMPPPKD